MMDVNPKLLNDLARLAVKYRKSDWEQLAAWISDEAQREQIRCALLDLAAVSQSARKRPRRRPKKRTPASRLREAITKVRGEDAARADLLDNLWLKLRERELLPTLAAVRAFGEAIGSKGIESTRRDQAVTELMERLLEMPGDALEERMRQTVVHDRSLGDEYEEWVRLILGRTPGIDAM
jgi:hypothetical protein